MKKQTKNQINRAFVEKELRFYNTADIRATLVTGGAMCFLFIPFAAFCAYFIWITVDASFLRFLLSAVGAILFSCPAWLHVIALVKSLLERKQLNNGEFDVAVRKVTYKDEKIVHRHVEQYLTFEGFAELSVGHTTYELATYGDVFYLVHYRGKKEIKLLYPEKMYEYNEQ